MFSSSDIHFEIDDETKALHVSITTERLSLESVTNKNLTDYSNLLGDAETVAKFADGEAWDADETKDRVAMWATRWNNNDPFSSLAVCNNDDDAFLGHVVLGYSGKPGLSELVYVFAKQQWGKGYGKEAVSAVVTEFAPEVVKRNYQLGGQPLSEITATARVDNDASVKILKSVGMKSTREEIKFGHNRFVFFVATADLCQKNSATINAANATESLSAGTFNNSR